MRLQRFSQRSWFSVSAWISKAKASPSNPLLTLSSLLPSEGLSSKDRSEVLEAMKLYTDPCVLEDIVMATETALSAVLDQEDSETFTNLILNRYHSNGEVKDAHLVTRFVCAFAKAQIWAQPVFVEGVDLITKRYSEMKPSDVANLNDALFRFRSEFRQSVGNEYVVVKQTERSADEEKNKYRLNRPSKGS